MSNSGEVFGGYYDGGEATAEKTGEAENKAGEGKTDEELLYPGTGKTNEEIATEAKAAEKKAAAGKLAEGKTEEELAAEKKAADEKAAENKTEEEKTAEAKAEEEKKAEAEKAKEAGLVTVEDLKLPEGMVVNEGIQEKFLGIVNDKDMTPGEKAQAMISLQQDLYTAQAEAHQEQVTAWEKQVGEDTEIIGDTGDKMDENLAIAKKGMDALKIEGLSELLKTTGLGSHPLIVKAFFRVGNSIGEDSFRTGGLGGKTEPKSDAEVLYPNQK